MVIFLSPHYPTLTIQYWNGNNLTKQFINAPIEIKPEKNSPSTIDSTNLLTGLGLIWGLGASIIVVMDIIYRQIPSKPLFVPHK